ncbi:MAG: SsrA-binding protein SmpB [Patescibacteria group bacterium]|nr:SsrA-binding protein SmpB [Patescibacteria group bacterium]
MTLSENKKAYFDYEILERFEAGIELTGQEVKSIRAGRINLSGSFIVIRNEEVWLLNVDIPPYQPKNAPENYDSKRTRRLLLKKQEIKHLIGKMQEKTLTLIPLRVYTKSGLKEPPYGRKIKIEIGLARSRRKADKRESIRKRDINREIRRNK